MHKNKIFSFKYLTFWTYIMIKLKIENWQSLKHLSSLEGWWWTIGVRLKFLKAWPRLTLEQLFVFDEELVEYLNDDILLGVFCELQQR